MKRTLKRESKVLEIVRREAIGAGGSSLVWELFSGDLLSGGPRVGECSRASALCSFLAQNHAFSPGDEPASASCFMRVADGHWGSRAWRAGFTAVSRRCATQRTCHRRGRGTN